MQPEAAVDAVATTLESWDVALGDQYRVHATDDGYRIAAAVEGVLLFEEVIDDAGRLLGTGEATVTLFGYDNGWLVFDVVPTPADDAA